MSQYNLRHYLEGQSDRAEAVLAAQRAPARITGGAVGPRLIRLFLNPAPHTRFSTIRGLTDDLALALRAHRWGRARRRLRPRLARAARRGWFPTSRRYLGCDTGHFPPCPQRPTLT